MSLIIVKFGGTSVGDLERIRAAASIVSEVKAKGNKVVVVVSAMAGVTNKLVSQCMDISQLDNDDKRLEYDAALATGEALSASLLSLALQELNLKSRSLQGWQVKIQSNSLPSNALIENVDNVLLNELINDDIIPVVTGFQAINSDNQITTLGRGGSDTTASAIAASLGADFCDIYTDVEGLYTCDPRLVHDAKLIEKISYEETLELAGSGAKVLHPRSVEICMRYGVPMRIFSSFTKKSGTIIMSNVNEINKITAISYLKKLSLVSIKNLKQSFAEFIESLAENGINLHQIIRSDESEIVFAIQFEYLSKLKNMLQKNNILDAEIQENIGSIVILGAAIRHDSKILSQILNTIKENNFRVLQITNSEIKLSLYLNDSDTESCVKILHKELINND